MSPAAEAPTWLSLDEAARRLAVHPSTLREWADKGRIRTFRTPGGHRRFTEADIAAFVMQALPDLELLRSATVGHARLAASEGRLASQAWYARFDEDAKNRQRMLGMDLVQSLITFLGEPNRVWSKEIGDLGSRYADLAREAGLSLGDTMRAFHLFEGLARSSVQQLIAAQAAAETELERNADWFLNEVQVAMVEAYSTGA